MFSEEEQNKLKKMVVYIAGAGGLGTHQAVELLRTGIKKIYLVDYDIIEPSNLNRQICYGREDIGKDKVIRAGEFLNSFKLGTEIVTIEEKINSNTAIPLDVDIIFDALDNFNARFVLSKLAEERDIPLIHGGIHSWYGQLTTIIPGKTRSLKEIFGAKSKLEGTIPAFSPVISVVASLQVIEGIKVFLEHEDILTNRLLLVNLEDYSLELIEL